MEPTRLSLVGDKTSKLGIAPSVMPTTLASPSLLGACADLGQVFDHDHAARPGTRNNLLGEYVVAIPAKPSLPAAHVLEMSRPISRPDRHNFCSAALSLFSMSGEWQASGGDVDASTRFSVW